MDRNTFVGIALIIGILMTFSYLNRPSEEQIKADQEKQREEFVQDSTRQANNQLAENDSSIVGMDTTNGKDSLNPVVSDSVLSAKLSKKYDVFAVSAQGTNEYHTIENDKLKITLASKGGKIVKAELKKYQSYKNYMIARDSLGEDKKLEELPILEPIYLFDEDSSDMYFNITMMESRDILTKDLYFTPVKTTADRIVLRAKTSNEESFLEMSYSLKDNYDVDFSLNFIGLDDIVDGDEMYFNWQMKSLLTEKEFEGQSRMSSVFYKPKNDGRTYLSEMSEASEEIDSKTNWVAFKHCYFSSVVISEDGFQKGGNVKSAPIKKGKYADAYSAELNISTMVDRETNIPLTFFFGPNDYEVLEAHNNEMEDIIDLGWGIFRWTAKWLIKPIFDFLYGFNIGMGLLILLLTIIVRLIILPLTYRNYKSSAKMKVLKPEIAEINEKYKNGDAAAKQKETMALYRRTGVNPMAGCLPIFIQMPILLAVFRFFPSTIKLRQESFLWAEDLSTYESVLDLPFSIPLYGDHVSLFTLLLCISTIFYTRMNSNQMAMPSQPGMPNMKVIMYLMPLMMLFFLNNYAAGLTFYYFVGNLITMGLMLVVKKYMIDEKKIRQTIEANKLKPKKKSAFQARLDEAMKQGQAKQKQNKQKRRK